MFLITSALVTTAAGARDQELVLFYAVSVFISFLVGLIAMARFSYQEARWKPFAMNVVGAVVVVFTLAADISRGKPIASVAVSMLIAFALYILWARAGKPRGVASVVSEAEHED